MSNTFFIQRTNDKNRAAVRELKVSDVLTRLMRFVKPDRLKSHCSRSLARDAPVTMIRRRLAIAIMRQRDPELSDFNDSLIEDHLNFQIQSLCSHDQQLTKQRETDDFYVECLLRAAFNMAKAETILVQRRPRIVR
jgi:hypothetical protein